MPILWRSHPYRQIAVPFADKLCGAGSCGTVAIFKHARTGRLHDAQKIFPFTLHTTETLHDPRQAQMYHIHISTAGDAFTPTPKVSTSSVLSRSRNAQTGMHSIRRPLIFTRLQTARYSQDKPYPFASEGFGVRKRSRRICGRSVPLAGIVDMATISPQTGTGSTQAKATICPRPQPVRDHVQPAQMAAYTNRQRPQPDTQTVREQATAMSANHPQPTAVALKPCA